MAERLNGLREQGAHASPDELVAELETAMEELRVTGEEIALQRKHIGELLEHGSQAQATVERLVAAMPTPVLTTDPRGLVVDANEPAGRLLGVPADRLRGKPLQAFVDVADRRAVRTLVSAAGEGTSPGPRTVSLTPRGRGRHRATLVAVPVRTGPDAAAEPQVRWFLDPTPAEDGSARGLALLSSFAELVTMPLEGTGDVATNPLIVAVATSALPEASDLTLVLGDPRHPELVSSSSARAQRADAAQLEVEEGPGVDAFLTDQVMASDSLSRDARWPTLAERIEATGIDAAVSVPLHGDAGLVGVLNLYATAGTRLDEPSFRTRAELFTRAAGSILREDRRVQELRDEADHLRRALVSRPEIDQAKGILMARFGYDAEDAFRHLVAVSQKRNVKLRDIASDVVAMARKGNRGAGTTDGGPPRRGHTA
jgi:PAS domain-containing protein